MWTATLLFEEVVHLGLNIFIATQFISEFIWVNLRLNGLVRHCSKLAVRLYLHLRRHIVYMTLFRHPFWSVVSRDRQTAHEPISVLKLLRACEWKNSTIPKTQLISMRVKMTLSWVLSSPIALLATQFVADEARIETLCREKHVFAQITTYRGFISTRYLAEFQKKRWYMFDGFIPKKNN